MLFNKRTPEKSPYSLPILLLVLAYIVSTITSINIQNSTKEIVKFSSLLSIFFLCSRTDKTQKKIIIKAIVITGAIISLYSIYQYFWGYEHTLEYIKKINSSFLTDSSYAKDILIKKRAIGTFPSPNLLGGYLIIVFFLSLSLIKNGTWNKKYLFGPILVIISLILTKSLGAWISLLTGLFVLFFIFYKSFQKHKLITLISLIFIVLIIGFIILNRWDRLMNLENPQNSITQRLNYWRTAIAIIKDHPVIGVGPGNFSEVFLRYKVGLSTDSRYAHNILLHQWAETGILGFIGIISLIIIFLRKSGREPTNIFIFLSGLSFMIHNLVDNTYFISQIGIFFWILISLT